MWMGVSGKEQIFILIDTFFYSLDAKSFPH